MSLNDNKKNDIIFHTTKLKLLQCCILNFCTSKLVPVPYALSDVVDMLRACIGGVVIGIPGARDVFVSHPPFVVVSFSLYLPGLE